MAVTDLTELPLQINEKRALEELKRGIQIEYPGAEIILFGSKARGEGSSDSDLDVLILIDHGLNESDRIKITDISYPIEIEYDVVFGKLIRNKSEWNTPVYQEIPFYRNVNREGVHV